MHNEFLRSEKKKIHADNSSYLYNNARDYEYKATNSEAERRDRKSVV